MRAQSLVMNHALMGLASSRGFASKHKYRLVCWVCIVSKALGILLNCVAITPVTQTSKFTVRRKYADLQVIFGNERYVRNDFEILSTQK